MNIMRQRKSWSKKDELRKLSNKFRELKTLIYEYRDKKEEEIANLNDNHQKLKNEIKTNQQNYERLIDEAANEISNFVEKANLENILNKFLWKSLKLEKNIKKREKQVS